MIQISPKALRFARLAAEQQPSVSASPLLIEAIKEQERALGQRQASERARRFVTVTDDTAAFCLRAIETLLQHPNDFEASDWDANDFAFLQEVARDLSHQLVHSGAQAL